ncbi:MAG TPA: hypothetical protein VK816_07020, partial [Jatrophihabitantaceae bacterium]|nr:hypothetical protein [Jatrophihabitantaceae bacterium]
FVSMARNLVAGGLGTAVIRLGWEFNLPYYRWSVASAADAADFATAWRQIVTAIRGVPGERFSFDWSPSLSPAGINPALAYPGNRYVSDIGLDVYDWSEVPGENAAQRWDGLVGTGYGLQWQATFAASRGKPVAFAEWGLVYASYAPGYYGGDDPLFVQNMYNWFRTHNTAFEDYFDSDTSYGLDAGLNTPNDEFPVSADIYVAGYSSLQYGG